MFIRTCTIRVPHTVFSLLCKARAYISWFGMMPVSHFSIWALYIIINHDDDDDALFNIRGTSQQFFLAVSLNSGISSREGTYYSVEGKETEAQRDAWLLDHTVYYSYSGYKTHNLAFLYSDTETVPTNSLFENKFYIKSFRYIWEAKKQIPSSNIVLNTS